jgi:hypothetical protein
MKMMWIWVISQTEKIDSGYVFSQAGAVSFSVSLFTLHLSVISSGRFYSTSASIVEGLWEKFAC